MEKELQEIRSAADSISLSSGERAEIRQGLLRHMENNPVRQPFLSRFRVVSMALKPLPVAVLVLSLFLAGSGVSYAAEGAVPGDALYPVKVGWNEGWRGALAVSPEAKAKWEARRAERRLDEAERLAALGELDPEKLEKIEERFVAHSDRVQEKIEKFRAKGMDAKADRLSELFDAAMATHMEILEILAGETEEGDEESGDEEGGEEDSDEDDGDDEDEDEGGDDDSDHFKKNPVLGKRRAAQHKISNIIRYIEKKEGQHDWEASEEVVDSLTAVEEAMEQAHESMEAGEHREAFEAFRSAHRSAQEAKKSFRSELKGQKDHDEEEGDEEEGDEEEGDEDSDEEDGDDEDEEEGDEEEGQE